ncbi:5-methylcytosine-specific restriction endonuclease system specificity protein McrC [Flavitalea antarctica]
MTIPIQNIYYLLCYAWNKMQEKDIVNVNDSDYDQLPDLLTKVLITGCNRLIKQGFDRNYKEKTEVYAGIKGKLDFNESIKTQAFTFGKSVCSFDEFSHDILSNQLLKGTLLLLCKVKKLDNEHKSQLCKTISHFHGVSDFLPTVSDFHRVQIHRNNSFYDFLLKVCKIIIQHLSLDEKTGNYKFRDLLRDQSTMQSLFEKFVYNFYLIRQSYFKVKSETFHWNAVPVNQSKTEYMPAMRTDISLTSKDRKIVLDTKYYGESLTMNQYNSLKFHSSNLYQIYSYLKNLEHVAEPITNKSATGILLYPTTSVELNETFLIDNHYVSVCTVNLATDWHRIEERLLGLLANSKF